MALKPIFVRLVLLSLLSFSAAIAVAETSKSVEVNGLFRDKAVVLINGESHLMSVGDEIHGVKLLASNSQVARLEIDGEVYELGVSRRVTSGYKTPASVTVSIPRDNAGHYIAQVDVDGRRIPMMVDTGATLITMSLPDAQRLGVDFRSGKQVNVKTANGDVAGWQVKLRRVTLESLSLTWVDAVVVGSDSPEIALLGNSFLSRVSMSQENGVLVLRSVTGDQSGSQ